MLANFKQMIIQMQRSVPLGEHAELARESEQLAVSVPTEHVLIVKRASIKHQARMT
jgi:hypothetical protein